MLIFWDVQSRTAPLALAQASWPLMTQQGPTQSLVLTGKGHIPMPANTPAAHASSLLALPADRSTAVMAFWFAGARESAADVHIAAASFDRAQQQWSPSRFVVSRHALAASLGYGVRRLGNPVSWLDASGKVHLYVVATGFGGWAAGRIVHLRQSNPGGDLASLTFEVVRVLPLSWLWNTSFLVRTAPLALKEEGMVLPVHFELGIKYPMALRFDSAGEFKGMVRISSRKHLLQPALLAKSESHWLALMRDQRVPGKVTVAQTTDSGQHWSDMPDLTLGNPDSSVAALALTPQSFFLAHNSSLRARSTLDLSTSSQGQNWSLTNRLAQGSGIDEYSYPAMTWADQSVWVTYTDQRRSIAWQRFSFTPSVRP